MLAGQSGLVPQGGRGRSLAVTYVGGPTALLEWHGLRLLTDPTFDPAGTVYELPGYALTKTQDPALSAEEVGRVDAVLLSHDHHFDNLDHAGRSLLPGAGSVLTTSAGATRLGGNATGLAPWESIELPAPDGATIRATATPARHGPAGGDRGPATGFALTALEDPGNAIYFSGDTVWYEGVEEVAERFPISVALLCLGAAKVSVAGESPLTLTAREAVEVAHAMPRALIVPLHYEGWEHFSESRTELEAAFAAAEIGDRVRWPRRGEPVAVSVGHPT